MRSLLAAVVLVAVSAVAVSAQTPTTQPLAPAPTAPVPAPAPAAPTPAPAPPVTSTPAPTSAAAAVAGRVLTIPDAVAIALENQPQIQSRLAAYAAARYRVDEALAPLLPQLTGTATATKSRSVFISTTPTGVSTVFPIQRDFPQTFGTQLQISQVIFDFGKNYAGVKAAQKTAEVSLAAIELQRQQIVDLVREAYTNINFAKRLIAVAQQQLDRAQLNFRSAQGGFEVGTRPKSDVVRAEVDIANANVAIIQARNAGQLGQVALATAMGLPADTPLQIQDNLVYQPVTLDPVALRETALRERPEYLQAKLNVDATDAQLSQANRNLLPDITGSAFYGASTTSLGESWAATLSFSWSIFDGGNHIARIREARANLDTAKANLRATELQIEQNVEQSRLNVLEAAERIQAAQKAVESAQENFRLAQGRFDAGVGTILELTDAQLALTQAQNTEAQALSDFQIALARLDLAVGRR